MLYDSAKLLLVDDDIPALRELSHYMSSRRFDVTSVSSVREARHHVVTGRPDVMLVQARMRGEDGLSLMRFAREVHDAGIIMLSTGDSVASRVIALERGADDYVTRPFAPRELVARVRSVLRRVRVPRTADGGAIDPQAGPPPRGAEKRSSLSMLMAQENALVYGTQALQHHGVDAAGLASWQAGRTSPSPQESSDLFAEWKLIDAKASAAQSEFDAKVQAFINGTGAQPSDSERLEVERLRRMADAALEGLRGHAKGTARGPLSRR